MKKVLLVVLLGLALVVCWVSGQSGKSAERTPALWTLRGSHTLFTTDVLTDESCLDCVLGDLAGGTKLQPTLASAPFLVGETCRQTTWDSSFTYCHVLVKDGDLAGTYGWVNERFIK